MSEERYRQPQLTLHRIYTRRGDQGETRLAGGMRIHKDSLRVEAYGTVDELAAFVGLARVTAEQGAEQFPQLAKLSSILLRVQHELFNVGSILATAPDDVRARQPKVTAAEVEQLEREMDEMIAQLPALPSFVLPGGSRLNAELHVARTVCRRAERLVVRLKREEPTPDEVLQYLNRLSDALFVWSRWANQILEVPEVLWNPNEATSARG